MNEFGPLNGEIARELERQHTRSARRTRPRPADRRTTRRSLTSRLHRLTDRPDG